MVSTRRNQPAARPAVQRAQSQSDQEPHQQPAVKTPRASRRKATGKTATPAVATKRRLRSAKDGHSPLRALPSPVKSKRKKAVVSVEKEPVIIESDSEAHAHSDAEGRSQVNQDASKAILRAVVRKPDQSLSTGASKTPANEPDPPPHTESEEDQMGSDSGVGPFFTMCRNHETAPPSSVRASEPSIEEAPEILEGSERAIELLRKIENSARPRLARRREEALRNSSEPVNQSVAKEQTPNTPGFFGRIVSVFTSPFTRATPPQSSTRTLSPPSTPRPDSPPPVEPPQELTLTLTPTPTPVGERSIESKTAKNKNHRHAMVKAVVKAVQDPEEQRKAGAWAQNVLEKMQGSSNIGEKRKRIEHGVRMGDLKHIPSQKPWVSTGYGMDDDIFDLSDNDDAPAWAVLRDMELDMESSKRPAKKRKSTHKVNLRTDDIVSLNDTAVPPTSDSSSAIFNSGGKTASRLDLRPRSSRIGSPMFDISPNKSDGEGNETSVHDGNAPVSPIQQSSGYSTPDQGVDAERRAAFEREFRRNGHVPGTNAWCVPDHSSDEESDEDTVDDTDHSSLWTQQPPPPPTPAHASLPAPVAESSATLPATLDPIELQRARITKHTPAKPSRLREVQVPSPSLRSDAGSESMTSSVFTAATPVPNKVINTHGLAPIPDAEPLDLPSEVRAVVEQYFETSDGHDYLATVSLWDDPVEYDFSDVDEV